MMNQISKEELRVKIAEIDGWHDFTNPGVNLIARRDTSKGVVRVLVPDYTESLDAIAPVEAKTIEQFGWEAYECALAAVYLVHNRKPQFKSLKHFLATKDATDTCHAILICHQEGEE